MAAITNNTGSPVRQGREKRGVSSKTPKGPGTFIMCTYAGRCRRPCFIVISAFERSKRCSTQQNAINRVWATSAAAGRLPQLQQ